jgi:hypothetical protein
VTKSVFDQMPNLTETFDQVKRSSEIWSSECFPLLLLWFFSKEHNQNQILFMGYILFITKFSGSSPNIEIVKTIELKPNWV